MLSGFCCSPTVCWPVRRTRWILGVNTELLVCLKLTGRSCSHPWPLPLCFLHWLGMFITLVGGQGLGRVRKGREWAAPPQSGCWDCPEPDHRHGNLLSGVCVWLITRWKGKNESLSVYVLTKHTFTPLCFHPQTTCVQLLFCNLQHPPPLRSAGHFHTAFISRP